MQTFSTYPNESCGIRALPAGINEGAHDWQQACDEHGRSAEALEGPTHAIQVFRAEQDVAAPSQRHGAPSAGARVAADRASRRYQGEVGPAGSGQLAGERHDDL